MINLFVPTFNNLDYLKVVFRSADHYKNSKNDHPNLIFINEGKDNFQEFVKKIIIDL